jgi:hypothetical protein
MNSLATAEGTFEWHVNPSTRPIPEAPLQESFKLTISHGGQSFVQDVVVERGQVLDIGEIRLG